MFKKKIRLQFFGTTSFNLKFVQWVQIILGHTMNDLEYKTHRQLEHPKLRPSKNGPGKNGCKVVFNLRQRWNKSCLSSLYFLPSRAVVISQDTLVITNYRYILLALENPCSSARPSRGHHRSHHRSPRSHHGHTMVTPWWYHGDTMVTPWSHHGQTEGDIWSPITIMREL